MAHPAPRHVGDVEQTVEPAQVDERTEVGDVLDRALSDLTNEELFDQRLALLLAFRLENDATRNNNVPATLVELDDLELVDLADEVLDVRHPSQSNLRTGQEGIDAHQVDGHAALDLADQRSLDRTVGLVRLADLLPDAQEVSLLLRQDDDTVIVLEALEQDLDLITFGRRILELVERDRTLRLEAELEDDRSIRDAQHGRLNNLAFSEGLKAAAELLQQSLEVRLGRGEDFLTIRIVVELRRMTLGDLQQGDSGSSRVFGGLGCGFLGRDGGNLTREGIDDDFLALGEVIGLE